MRTISAAKSVASSPPVPARISRITFFSSFGSVGISRSLSSLSAFSIFDWSDSSSRRAISRISSSSEVSSSSRASVNSFVRFFHAWYFCTTSPSVRCCFATFAYADGLLSNSGDDSSCVNSSYLVTICSSLSIIQTSRHFILSGEWRRQRFSGLRLQLQRFLQRFDRDFELLIVRFLRGDVLQPHAGFRHHFEE